MVQIFNSIPEYKVSNSGIKQEDVQNTIAKSKQAVADNFESNSAGKVLSGIMGDSNDKNKILLLIPPLYLLDKLVDKYIGRTDGKGLFDRAAGVGDKISHVLHLDKIISEDTGSKLIKRLRNNRLTKYFTKDYKAVPKLSIAKGTTLSENYSEKLRSVLSAVKHDYNYAHLFKAGEGALSSETIKALENMGPLKSAVTPEYLETVKKALFELGTKAKTEADRKTAFSLINRITDFIGAQASGKAPSSTEGIASEIASVLSVFKDKKQYGDLLVPASKTFSSDTLKVLSSVANQGDKVVPLTADKIVGAADDIVSKGVDKVNIKGLLMPKKENLSVLNNKLKAAEKNIGKTGLGKLFAKGALKTKDILTYGGGLLSLYFVASALVQATKAAKEAPKGEKKATFMHVLSEHYVGILLFQPSISMLYRAGGNKYRGMSVEARNALKELIKKVNSNPNLTKEGYKVAKMQKELLLRGVDKDKVAQLAGKGLNEAKGLFKSLKNSGTKIKLWERPLRAAGRLLDIGLDKIKNPSMLGKIKDKIKGFGGGLGRFLIIMMVLQPLLQKPVTKLCHKIFGKPTTYLKAHGEEDKKNKKNKVNNTQPAQPEMIPAAPEKADNHPGETNLLKMYTEQEPQEKQETEINASSPMKDMQPIKPSKNEEIPAFNLFKKDDSEEEERYYIPSIKVDTSYVKKQNKELEKEVDEFIKQKNKALKHY